jgi:ParB family transcriptional regulator, chromosome partitioning protein
MRLPWRKAKADQLELLDADPELLREPSALDQRPRARSAAALRSTKAAADHGPAITGHPLLVPLDCLSEDPNNPRTEFPQAEIDELAASIRQHGVLQPLVVCPADAAGRYRIHHGAKRYRAANIAGLSEVPVMVSDAPADPYAQSAENQKRHGLTPLDMARLIRRQADAGDSNATISKCLGIDQTTIAHHLALLDLPSELNDVMQAGRCTSPRTLYELRKLHHEQPERVRALLGGEGEITRGAVNAVRAEAAPRLQRHPQRKPEPTVLAQAKAACARLEHALDKVAKADLRVADPAIQLLKQRIASLGTRMA